MMQENYRVEQRRNVNMNGRKTAFKFFKRVGNAFVYAGDFTADGWDATTDDCIDAAVDAFDFVENMRSNERG